MSCCRNRLIAIVLRQTENVLSSVSENLTQSNYLLYSKKSNQHDCVLPMRNTCTNRQSETIIFMRLVMLPLKLCALKHPIVWVVYCLTFFAEDYFFYTRFKVMISRGFDLSSVVAALLSNEIVSFLFFIQFF